MIVFYYLFGPFILLALALWPLCYGTWFGVRLGSRPGAVLLLHLILMAVIILLVTPVPLVDKNAGAHYGTYWPAPMGVGWFVRDAAGTSFSPEALRLYWRLASFLAGCTSIAASLGYCGALLRNYFASRSGRA
jgi:hypothetical protein